MIMISKATEYERKKEETDGLSTETCKNTL